MSNCRTSSPSWERRGHHRTMTLEREDIRGAHPRSCPRNPGNPWEPVQMPTRHTAVDEELGAKQMEIYNRKKMIGANKFFILEHINKERIKLRKKIPNVHIQLLSDWNTIVSLLKPFCHFYKDSSEHDQRTVSWGGNRHFSTPGRYSWSEVR